MSRVGAPKGNRNGAHDKPWTRALERLVQQDADLLRKLAIKTFDMALEGDAQARAEITNRLDGKPVQPVDMSGSIDVRQTAEDLTDDQLASIAAGSSGRAIAKTPSPQKLN